LGNFDDDDRARENIRQNIHILATEILGYYELKQLQPWFHEECSKLLDQRKQAKLQWFQNLSDTNGNDLNNVKCEISRPFRNIKSKYPDRKIHELETVRTKI